MDDQVGKVAKDGTKRFPCAQCGAQLAFSPGAQALKCQHCGFLNQIQESTDGVEELDYLQHLVLDPGDSVEETEETVHCNACAASFSIGVRTTASSCPFCGSNVVVPVPKEIRIRPKAVLPFSIDNKKCRDIYGQWISSRFWAPNALKAYARADHGITGMYLPYWTYDSDTTSDYTGARGEHYYETETYTDYEDGEPVTRTRQVQRTRWWPAAGTVARFFDDVLTPASTSLPTQHVLRLETWDTSQLVAYRDEYLSGFSAERYSISLEQGFGNAKQIMDSQIYRDVCADIGGDEQRVDDVNTQYAAITFKHILVPIWLGAYKFKGKTYRFLINGRTGEISGDAPISPWKVAIAIILGLIIVGVIIALVNK